MSCASPRKKVLRSALKPPIFTDLTDPATSFWGVAYFLPVGFAEENGDFLF